MLTEPMFFELLKLFFFFLGFLSGALFMLPIASRF